MFIDWPSDEIDLLREKMLACPDCEPTGQDEYVIDFFETEAPMSMEIALGEKTVSVLAAEALAYDEDMDGWYIHAPITDAALIQTTLKSLL